MKIMEKGIRDFFTQHFDDMGLIVSRVIIINAGECPSKSAVGVKSNRIMRCICFSDEILSGQGIDDPTDKELWDVIYHLDSLEREAAYDELRNVFNGKFLAVGTCGRWIGNFAGGFIFETFDELLAGIRSVL